MTTESVTTKNAENCLYRLWEASADRLTDDDLRWFKSLIDHAEFQAVNLSSVIEGVGCMVADDDTGSFSSNSRISDLLFSINSQLETITGLIHVSSAAAHRLSKPEFYQKAKTTGHKAKISDDIDTAYNKAFDAVEAEISDIINDGGAA